MKKIANGLYEWITQQDKELLEDIFEKMIYNFLKETAYEWVNNNPEWWFKTFLWMFLRLNNIYYYPEVQNLIWRKDLVIPLNNEYYIIEAKVDKSCKEAIDQINKNYVPQFTDGKKIIKTAFNWDRNNKKVDIVFK